MFTYIQIHYIVVNKVQNDMEKEIWHYKQKALNSVMGGNTAEVPLISKMNINE